MGYRLDDGRTCGECSHLDRREINPGVAYCHARCTWEGKAVAACDRISPRAGIRGSLEALARATDRLETWAKIESGALSGSVNDPTIPTRKAVRRKKK